MKRGGAMVAALCIFLSTGRAFADEDSWTSPDKFAHFGVSTAIASAAYGTAWALGSPNSLQRAVWGGSIALAAGAGKELTDLAGYGTPSWKDFAWDAIGTATGVAVMILVDHLVTPSHGTRTAAVGTPLIQF
jgi:uncharacterized protein YfiM (DUF2279 family)